MRVPRRRGRTWWAVAALAAGLGLLAYLFGAAPGVLWGDSAELQAAGIAGGVAHPSGYPTFILLGQLFGKLLPGNPAWRLNAMSAAFGAAALAAFVLVLAELGLSRGGALAGALVYGASFTFWWASIRCEVYTLAIALFLLSLWRSLVALRTRRIDDACAAAYLMGLSITGSMLFGPPTVLMGALVAFAPPLRAGRRLALWAVLIALFLAGLSPYATLALADRNTEATNYLKYTIDLAGHQFGLTPEAFASPFRRVLWLLFGAESHPITLARPPRALARVALAGLAQLFLFEFGPLGLLLAGAGAWRLRGQAWPRRALLAGLAAIPLAFAATAMYGKLLSIFLIPCAIAVAALVALGLDAIIAPIERGHGTPAGLAAGALAVALVVPVPHLLRVHSHEHPIGPLGWSVIEEWEPRIEGVVPSLRHYDAPRRYGERAMRALPAHAYAMGRWKEIMVLKYLQEIEGARPDVTFDPWYPAHVARLERWQASRAPHPPPLVMIGPVPPLRPLFGAADSIDLGGGDFLLVRAAPLVREASR